MKKYELFGSENQLKRLHPGECAKDVIKRHTRASIKRICLILATGVILGVLVYLTREDYLIEDRYINRASEGEGTTEYTVRVIPRDREGILSEQEVRVSVSEKKLTGTELELLYERAYEYIERAVLGDNPDAEHITQDLCFVTEIPGTVMSVSWEYPDLNYVFSDGRLRRENILEPIILILSADIRYFGEIRSRQFAVRLIPAETSEKESFTENLTAALEETDRRDPESGWIELPEEIDGIQVDWREAKDLSYVGVISLSVIAALLMIPATRADLSGRLKKREAEMARDYPDIISQFVMLGAAGMTTRSIWSRICDEYRVSKTRIGRRYAYEEMLVSEQELEMGVPEARVYEDYGIRCGTVSYQKLGSLLSRNLRRGSRELNHLLLQESEEAFAERRTAVRVKSEELGTKLLIPMTVMMCIIIAVIIVPAFRSFTI